MRVVATAFIVSILMTDAARADLQTALVEALGGLPTTSITAEGPRLGVIPRLDARLSPLPEDVLFANPLLSTLGQPAFLDGPNFTYDASTGTLKVTAPPVFGGRDEFGQREEYSPTLVRVVAPGHFATRSPVASILKYRRNPYHALPSSAPFAQSAGSSSFVTAELDIGVLSLSEGGYGFEIGDLSVDDVHTAATVGFPNLLDTDLSNEVFQVDEDRRYVPLTLESFRVRPIAGLPEVQVLVRYKLAIPTTPSPVFNQVFMDFVAERLVPEPSSITLVMMCILGIALRRPNRS